VLHPPRVVSGFQDLAVVRDAIEHGGGHLLVAEDLGPFPEAQIGGDDHRGLLVELGD
jgi:hypothetical protein